MVWEARPVSEQVYGAWWVPEDLAAVETSDLLVA